MDEEIVEADAATKKIVENISANADPSTWNPKMARIVGFALQTIGSRAVDMARAGLYGNGFGVTGATAAALHGASPWLRRNRVGGTAPLLDSGKLARSLRATVNVSAGLVTLAPAPGSVSSHHGIPLPTLAQWHENGHSFTVTKRMKIYFAAMIAYATRPNGFDLRSNPRRFKLSNPETIEAMRVIMGQPEGKTIQVPPRPFMRPALEGAFTEFFMRTHQASFLRAVFGAWSMGESGMERLS